MKDELPNPFYVAVVILAAIVGLGYSCADAQCTVRCGMHKVARLTPDLTCVCIGE